MTHDAPVSAPSSGPGGTGPGPGLAARLRRTLRQDDAPAARAAASGERLVARIRLIVVAGLLIMHLFTARPEPPRPVRGPVLLAFACAILAYRLSARPRGRWLAFASSGLDVSAVTAALAGHVLAGEPYAAVNNPLVFEVYFLTLGIAALRFDWQVCALTGLLAFGQYAGLVLWVASAFSLDSAGGGLPQAARFQWYVQLTRLGLLAAATVVACAGVFRARYLRTRLAEAVRAAERHEKAQQIALLEERQRLSRDLHDSVTQLLFSVTLVAQSVGPAWRRDAAEGERKIQRLLELTQSALREMRALLSELRPSEPVPELARAESALVGISRIRSDGLAGALRRHGVEVGSDAVAVEVDDAAYAPQPLEKEEVLYRIAQEALNNVVKHARARLARVVLAVQDGAVSLTVSDDGLGFDAEQAQARAFSGPQAAGGFGLISMRERVEALRGVLRISSSPGQGTTVRVAVPARTASPAPAEPAP